MNKDTKKKIMEKHQSHAKDTGSPAVQIAILTAKILGLIEHLKAHHKDNHSRKGLLAMVGQRSKLLRYLKMNNKDKYVSLIADLGLRK